MPSEEDENEQSNLLELCITKDCLLQELRSNPSRLIILDCRSSDEFGESHIRNAVNFSIPSIMLRRLAAGKIELTSTIKCRDLKEKIVNAYKENLFVIYSDSYITDKLFQKNSFTAGDTIHVLAKRLLKDGCRVVCLEDGFGPFRASYPEWCESCSDTAATSESERDPSGMAMPLMGLRSLRISAWRSSGNRSLGGGESSGTFSADESSPSDSADERCDSSLGLDEDRDFPVEILPHLYLGNAANSVDAESLDKYGIQYILNVTPDLPNVFEERIKYMNIPITDHWSQNLASFFPKAIEFIDEARGQNKGVLVHCLAGVSRSVTVTVAYLMARHQLSLNDAFCLVRARKSNIAPNFHFMEQLHTFERQLNDANATPHSSSRSPAAVRCEACGLVEAADTCRKCCNSPDRRPPAPPSSATSQRPPPSTATSTTSTSSSTSSTFLSPLKAIGQSPDSGIEFDRWNESSPAPNE